MTKYHERTGLTPIRIVDNSVDVLALTKIIRGGPSNFRYYQVHFSLQLFDRNWWQNRSKEILYLGFEINDKNDSK